MSTPTVLGVACDVYVSPADCISQRERIVCDTCADAHPDAADPTPVDRADVTTPRQGSWSGDDVDERWPTCTFCGEHDHTLARCEKAWRS